MPVTSIKINPPALKERRVRDTLHPSFVKHGGGIDPSDPMSPERPRQPKTRKHKVQQGMTRQNESETMQGMTRQEQDNKRVTACREARAWRGVREVVKRGPWSGRPVPATARPPPASFHHQRDRRY